MAVEVMRCLIHPFLDAWRCQSYYPNISILQDLIGPARIASYIDFLWGCTLQEMVCPSSTFTHLTIYACVLSDQQMSLPSQASLVPTFEWISSCSRPAIVLLYCRDIREIMHRVEKIWDVNSERPEGWDVCLQGRSRNNFLGLSDLSALLNVTFVLSRVLVRYIVVVFLYSIIRCSVLCCYENDEMLVRVLSKNVYTVIAEGTAVLCLPCVWQARV